MKQLSWIQKNLFSDYFNTILTCLWLLMASLYLPGAIHWLIIDATWYGFDPDTCTSNGACWIFIKLNLSKLIYGLYPVDLYWRIHTIGLTLIGLLLLLFCDTKSQRKLLWFLIIITIFPIFCLLMLYGFGSMTRVPTSLWGGITLNLTLATLSLILSTPYGILLALGRRSNLPIFRYLSIGLIEFIRGVPLITLLFMAAVMLPLFFPANIVFDKVARIVFILTLFGGAYIAECVRGGLDAIPESQFESAQSLGLSYWKMMILIILPQALRISLPAIMNTFIAIVKDTSLVTIIGLLDILGILTLILSDIRWTPFFIEGFLTLALIFWLICFSLSRISRHIERTYTIKH